MAPTGRGRFFGGLIFGIGDFSTGICEPQRRSDNAHTERITHYQHRAHYAWQALQQSKVQFDPQHFGCAFQTYAEAVHVCGLRVWPFVVTTGGVWVRV